jgi:hypothetical protein
MMLMGGASRQGQHSVRERSAHTLTLVGVCTAMPHAQGVLWQDRSPHMRPDHHRVVLSWLQVPDPEQQHRVMIEAVENHMPQVVVIDEIGTEAECSAARTIAQVRLGVTPVVTVDRRTVFGGGGSVCWSRRGPAHRSHRRTRIIC